MKRRNWPHELHILFASGILLTVLVLAYQIAVRHNRRIDLTQEKVHSLSAPSVEVLRQMERDEIWVRAFFAEGDEARRKFGRLLKQMGSRHPHFRYEFHDPDRSPSETRQYRVDSYQTVIVESRGRQQRFQGVTEEGLTNALIRIAHPQPQTLCFTAGHGESSLTDEDRTGMSQWKQALENYQYRIREIQFTARGIPPECNALIMAGPHYELLPQEIDLLQKFSESGKGFLLLIDPMDPGTGTSFVQLARSFGIELGGDVVVDKVSRIFGGDYLIPLIATYSQHPITERFRAATFFPIARTVNKSPETPEGIKITELAKTNPGGWAEHDLKKLEDGEAELNPEEDTPGPVSIAAASELLQAPKGSRWVVVGDSDFVTNAHLGISGNRDFVLNILQWLVKDDRWISIRVKTSRFEPLFLRVNQSVGVAAFAIGGLPLTILAVGSAGIMIRRHRAA